MKKISPLLGLIFLCWFTAALQAQGPNLIPRPADITLAQGSFKLNANTRIAPGSSLPADFFPAVNGFRQLLNEQLGLNLESVPPNTLTFNQIEVVHASSLAPEAYTLTITPEKVLIQARSGAGAFYAFTTLRQLLGAPLEHPESFPNHAFTLPCLTIHDEPRFPYRGMHLDVCRHFFTVEEVKAYIDNLAYHKFNTFHWHLTEDQGWRIEIKKYPRLTEVGSHRAQTRIGHAGKPPEIYDHTPHGGFYTQEQIREVVEYARQRYVRIIPEIELPGHALAALSAYPQYSCTGGPFTPATTWGVFDDVYCAGNDSTLTFIRDILNEVCDLFPGEYIHIGGDECPKTRWHACPKCQRRMQTEQLKDEHELQSWFIRQVETMLQARGKKMIGWDEILEGGLAPSATVMSWRGTEGGISAARMAHDVIMTPGNYCYFDHYQAAPEIEPLAIGGMTNVEEVYGYNPVPASLTPGEAKYILGAQCNLWTEYIPTVEHLEYMAWPRACALAEVLWSGPGGNWPDFQKRLQTHFLRLQKKGIHCATHLLQR